MIANLWNLFNVDSSITIANKTVHQISIEAVGCIMLYHHIIMLVKVSC
jgi:hypothetical protein